MRALVLSLLMCLPAVVAEAQDGPVRLSAPERLEETGLLAYLLPRFSLKTQVRVTVVGPDDASDLSLGSEGAMVFVGPEQSWHLALAPEPSADAQRFADWLGSEIGQRTILAFAPEGVAEFGPPEVTRAQEVETTVAGDAAQGYDVSRRACARCHAVDAAGRKNDIGSTPSFSLLRGMEDWTARFSAFYMRAPHGAFTQVDGVTEPFAPDRPPPIVPVEITLEEVEAVMAYVATLAPADLGAPIRSQ